MNPAPPVTRILFATLFTANYGTPVWDFDFKKLARLPKRWQNAAGRSVCEARAGRRIFLFACNERILFFILEVEPGSHNSGEKVRTSEHRELRSAEDLRFAIVVSRWNEALTSSLLRGAREALAAAGGDDDAVEVFHVPGSFELPLACLRAAETGRFDAVVALGVVIRGETPHFDYVAGEAARGVMQAGLDTGIPVLFGVITADTEQQAKDRAGEGPANKGYDAAASAIEMARLFRRMDELAEDPPVAEKVLPHVV
jgi:6,7-dimethyl-8-ribityllumazine synthase